MPYERNPRFTGRELELSKLESLLFQSGRTSKAALIGLGGSGKTNIAIELVYRSINQHRDCSIFWIPATDPESLLQAYLVIADKLQISNSDEKNADVDVRRLVQTHLSKESAGPWLIIYDNADDLNMWMDKPAPGQGTHRLIDCVPKHSRGSVLFTTRDRKVAVKLAQRSLVDVQAMEAGVAKELLHRCLIESQSDSIAGQSDATKLVEQLTYLPLAIIQAAAYINANGLSIAEYLSLFTEQDETAIELLSEDFEDEGRYESMTVKNPVAMTWLISFERMKQNDLLAADYLSFMACIEPKDIPQSLLPPGVSRKKELDAIGTLDAYSFITRKITSRSFDLHRLVHLAMRNWLKETGRLDEWRGKTIEQLRDVFPTNDDKYRATWRAYLPHARYALLPFSCGDYDESHMGLAWRVGLTLHNDGRYADAEASLTNCLQASKRIMGDGTETTLSIASKVAATYRQQGRWADAESLELRMLDELKVLGNEQLQLQTMRGLAGTYQEQGRSAEAERLDLQSLDAYRASGNEEEIMAVMSDLATNYCSQGRFAEAETMELEVMETRKRVSGDDNPRTLRAINNLALTYNAQGRFEEAHQLAVVALEARQRVLGHEHPDSLESMNVLASTYWKLGRWPEAEALEARVLDTQKKVLGWDHPSTLVTMANLAATYSTRGKLAEAEQLEILTFDVRKRVMGNDHPATLTSMNNLAWTLNLLERHEEAINLMAECFELRKQKLGEDHQHTRNSGELLQDWRASMEARDPSRRE